MDELIKATFNADGHAGKYDKKAEKAKWHAPEIVFGLAFDYIMAGESILDLGIGTGLSSKLFSKAGLKVYGMDFSEKMLEECRKKNFAEDLRQHDLSSLPYPFDDSSMNHAISVGVFQLIEDTGPIFREAKRIIKKDGLFSFAAMHRKDSEDKDKQINPKVCGGKPFTVYSQSEEETKSLLSSTGFKLLHKIEFSAVHAGKKTSFVVYTARAE
ncbi:MAG: class I SAM-dependent methyltransferase [Spirochaetales bacterium]|nr:class I SAM-dependent methyltransferase [Spirochaetales bacterium]